MPGADPLNPKTPQAIINVLKEGNPWVKNGGVRSPWLRAGRASKNDFRCTLKRVETIKKRSSQVPSDGEFHYRVKRGHPSILRRSRRPDPEKWTVHPSSKLVPGRARRLRLRPGWSAAHERYRLRLLPPGSDLVHERPPRGTRPSTPLSGVLAPKAEPLGREFSPARADCG